MTPLKKQRHELYGKKSRFGDANRINSDNFNATTVELEENFYDSFLYLFTFGNIYLLWATVSTSKNIKQIPRFI